ncbi:MAG: lipoyl synthase [Actinobacteria bacterium]|nr:lipoyl synthase [Actinomycetota bacterium]
MNRKPDWLKRKISLNSLNINQVRNLIYSSHLNTVCQSAKCPNIFECFGKKTATFMLMGNICTRNCGFCGIKSGKPEILDEDEPSRVANAVKEMGLKYVVITSVTRDDLPDGGVSHFAKTVSEINRLNLELRIECLIPDFKGNVNNLEILLAEDLNVLNHNMETVKKNFSKVRKYADYETSLNILKSAKSLKPDIYTKSGFMLGLGENREEIVELLSDLKEADCDIVTIGQYLRPSGLNIQVKKYYRPEEFESIKELAENFNFKAVISGIFVRSSYGAGIILDGILNKNKTKN